MADKEKSDTFKGIFYMILMGFLSLYFFIEAYFEKRKPKIGHTTGVIVILGILTSLIMHLFTRKDPEVLMHYVKFDEESFFDLILPIIVYPSGYNMRRKKFFSNIGTILKFGFVATIVCFATYSGLLYTIL